MVRTEPEKQLMLDGFETEFEKWVAIDSENKWIKLSEVIPWEALSQAYNQTLCQNVGRPGKEARHVIGALILKHYYHYSDEETIEQIQMNPYYQYFLGFKAFDKKPVFAPSLFVEIRKRMNEDVYKGFEQTLTGEIEKLKTGHRKTSGVADNDDSLSDEEKKQLPEQGQCVEAAPNKGQLIIDATIADQDIRYPTDINLLNKSREISEQLIDELYNRGSCNKKPRTYRQQARKSYLSFVKQKRRSKRTRRKLIKKQLQYVKRNLSHIDTLLNEQIPPVLYKPLQVLLEQTMPLNPKRLRQYHIIQHIYQQQQELYSEDKCSIAHRIVSIHIPEVRPMVRGKTNKNVEFGAKIGVGITQDGLSYLDHLSWDAYNECDDLAIHVDNYKKCHGYYPEKVLADNIYGTRKNREALKGKGITFGGKRLGRPKKETDENKDELKKQKQQAKQDHCDRIPVEGKFGQGKRGYRLNNILRQKQVSHGYATCFLL